MKSLPFGVLMLLSLLVSAAVSFGITPIVKRVAYKVGAVDVPKDERRMHSVPIPRLGGLAIAIAFSADCGIICPGGEQMQGILLGAVVILVLGVLDDCLTLRAWFKFLVQIFAAYLVTSHGCTIRYFTQSHCNQLGAVPGPGSLVCAHYHCLDCGHHQRSKFH